MSTFQDKYKIGSYPLYHTEYETFDAVKNLLDKDFEVDPLTPLSLHVLSLCPSV